MGVERKIKEAEPRNSMKVFILPRDFYSNPQVFVIVARDRKEAERILKEQYKEENNPDCPLKSLKELDLNKPNLLILEPPGDRHLI